jgi:tetratricopeptide (TPR) repeat protein
MTPEGRVAGRQYCEQATALDPHYALAYVVLAESSLWSAFFGSSRPREAFTNAKEAALRALELDRTIADAHSALGTVLGSGEFDWEGAEHEFQHALELSPAVAVRYDFAWCYAMWFLLPLGRVGQAVTEMQRAVDLDPLDPFYNSLLGYLLDITRQPELAITQLEHAMALDPTFFFSHWFLSIAYSHVGRLDKALIEAEKANELSGGIPLTLGSLSGLYGRVGRTDEARRLLEQLMTRQQSSYVPASALAWAYAGVGATDDTLSWIARSIDERDPTLVTALKAAPTYDPLRSRPEYTGLLRKINLVP